jgi:cytochrome P450
VEIARDWRHRAGDVTLSIDESSGTRQFDLTDAALYTHGNPHELFAWLRRNRPVFRHAWHGGQSFIALVRYADIVRVYDDPLGFSSTGGTLLSAHRIGHDPAGGKMLAMTDPPRHTQLRRMLARHFTPRAIAALEARIEQVTRHLVGVALEERTCDFVDRIAAPLPLAIICELLGVERSDWPIVLDLTHRAFGATDTTRQREAHHKILLFFLELANARRGSPRDDLVTTIATAKIDGQPLTDEEVLLNCNNLLIGGTEATRHAATGGLLAFIESPDQWQLLPVKSPTPTTAVEEILRWTTPPTHLLRTATAPCEIGDLQVARGDVVALWNLSANRDEAVFVNPDRFDVKRASNPHLTLGVGHHYCIGAFLARAELSVLFSELRRRVKIIETTEPATRLASCVTYGFERMPVAVHPT